MLAIAAFAFGSQVASSATTSTAAPASLSQSQTPGLGIELVVHGAAALVGVGFVAAASRGTTDPKTA